MDNERDEFIHGWDETDFNELNEASAEDDFRDAYEAAHGVRPVFSVDYLSVDELQDRTENLQAADAAGRFA